MRKRLRKKLHKDEFQEFGFLIVWQFREVQASPQLDVFMDALIDAVMARGLTFGGGTNQASGSGFVCRIRGSAQEADRAHLQQWLHNRPEIEFVQVDDLEDAWNPDTRQYQHVKGLLESNSELNTPTIVILPPPDA